MAAKQFSLRIMNVEEKSPRQRIGKKSLARHRETLYSLCPSLGGNFLRRIIRVAGVHPRRHFWKSRAIICEQIWAAAVFSKFGLHWSLACGFSPRTPKREGVEPRRFYGIWRLNWTSRFGNFKMKPRCTRGRITSFTNFYFFSQFDINDVLHLIIIVHRIAFIWNYESNYNFAFNDKCFIR